MDDRILREPEVKRLSGLSRTTRWRLERQGEFPRRLQISENAIGWLDSEIRLWIESRQARRPEVLLGAGLPDVQPRQEAGQREDQPDEGHHNLARRLTRRQKTQTLNNLNHQGR
jgi:prophage regulatory protein